MSDLKELVEKLPEIYQNIYGFPEFNGESSRNCEIRKSVIIKTLQDFQKKLGKTNLKILDLGCAQGFYSFSAAEVGCEVHGIDFCAENIELCNALVTQNHLNCTFECNKITRETIDRIESYDVIFLFSVIHHISNENGFEYARKLLNQLCSKAKLVVTELAVKEEPLYWNKSLPSRYDDWFDDISFYDELEEFDTHLSEFKRPMLVCSNEYCYVGGIFYKIDQDRRRSFDGNEEDVNRRYFFCDGGSVFVKRFSKYTREDYKKELQNEIDIVNDYEISFAPKLIDFNGKFDRIIVAYGIQFGETLWDALKVHRELDFAKIFNDVLDNCVELEKKGLFHSDIRSWNVCINKSGEAYLIDFGAITREKKDMILGEMYDCPIGFFYVYDTFVSFLYDCLIGKEYSHLSDYKWYSLSFSFDLDTIPQEYANFIRAYLLLDECELDFEVLKELFCKYVLNKNTFVVSAKENEKIYKNLINRNFIQKGIYSVENKLILDSYKKTLLELGDSYKKLRLEMNSRLYPFENWIIYRSYVKLVSARRELRYRKKLNLEKKNTIWFDVTSFCENHSTNNGVNRVVRNVLEYLPQITEKYNFVCVSGITGKYHPVDMKKYSVKRKLPINPLPGDIYLSIDLNPVQPVALWSELGQWQSRGCKIIGCVYDLVYILYPEFVSDSNAVVLLERWLRHAASYYDGLICISETVENELHNWMRKEGIENPRLKTGFFHLGCDFIQKNEESAPSEEVRLFLDKIENKQVYIAVSTIEPRKGYDLLIDSFEMAKERGMKNSALIIVGRKGWKSEEIVKKIGNSDLNEQSIFWFSDCDDTTLDILYKHSDYYVSCSHYEGFNLGIVEAAQRGIPSVLSDIPVHHEVSGDNALFFEGSDSLADLILKLENENTVVETNGIKSISWQESAGMIWNAVNRVIDQ